MAEFSSGELRLAWLIAAAEMWRRRSWGNVRFALRAALARRPPVAWWTGVPVMTEEQR